MQTPEPRADYFRFFRSWIADPLGVSAIAPSSRSLARLMTEEISGRTGPVLELGPGTGVFTRALLEQGVAPADLTVIEFGSDFARLLNLRFPDLRVVWMDAAQLGRYPLYDGSPVGAVVSGLPLLSMAPRKVEMILTGACKVMRPDASFYQFTYGARCPVPDAILKRLDLEAEPIGRTFYNLPPATVYRLRRRDIRHVSDLCRP